LSPSNQIPKNDVLFSQNFSRTMLNCPPLTVTHNTKDQMSWEVLWSIRTELKSSNNTLETDNGKHPLILTKNH